MTGPAFTVRVLPDGDYVATCDDPRLAEVQWRWTPGTGQVEYGLPGHPVGVVNVYDYRVGAARIAPTVEALAAELAGRYADPAEVDAVRTEVAHGD